MKLLFLMEIMVNGFSAISRREPAFYDFVCTFLDKKSVYFQQPDRKFGLLYKVRICSSEEQSLIK